MTMPYFHKKDEVRATGTLEARTPRRSGCAGSFVCHHCAGGAGRVLPFIYVVVGPLQPSAS